MDEGLRRAERGQDWEQEAAGLRRAGQLDHARRILRAAASGGEIGALEALEACFPVEGEAALFLAWLTPPPGQGARDPGHIRRQAWAASALVAAGDPRFDRSLRDILRGPSLPGPSRRSLQPVAELLEVSAPERVLLSRGFPGWLPNLVDLAPGEVLALTERAAKAGSSLARLRLGALLEGSEGPAFVDAQQGLILASHSDPLAQRTLELVCERVEGRGRGVPTRPAWARPAFRDPRTYALSADVIRAAGAPFGTGELPETEWLALFDLDRAELPNLRVERGERLRREVTVALQSVLGDRVIAWVQDRWLVPWQGADAPQVMEKARVALRQTPDLAPDLKGVTLSAGLTRVEPDAANVFPRLEHALVDAISAGRDQLQIR